MKIGILQCDNLPAELQDNYPIYGDMLVDMMQSAGMQAKDFQIFNLLDTEASQLPELFAKARSECDRYLISGSHCGAYDDIPWINALKKFIHDGFTLDAKKFVGICFGHQIIANVMQANVQKAPNGWGFGIHHYETKMAKSEFDNLDVLKLYAFHGDQITSMPENAKLLAGSDFCPYAMLQYSDVNGSSGLSIQPHPEFSADYTRDLLNHFAGKFWTLKEASDKIEKVQTQKVDSFVITKILANFLQK